MAHIRCSVVGRSYLPPKVTNGSDQTIRVSDNKIKDILEDIKKELRISNKYEADKADEEKTEEDLT